MMNFQGAGAQQGNFYVVSVNGEMGAMAYPVGAGNTVIAIDWNGKDFWIKSTDANGLPQAMRKFHFEEEIPPTPEAAQSEEMKEVKAELAEMKEQLKALLKNVNKEGVSAE